jgi:hypothetical protein
MKKAALICATLLTALTLTACDAKEAEPTATEVETEVVPAPAAPVTMEPAAPVGTEMPAEGAAGTDATTPTMDESTGPVDTAPTN